VTYRLPTFEEVRAPFLNSLPQQEKKMYSERTAETIDAEIVKLLDDAHARVRDTLNAKRELLNVLAKMLLEKETVDRSELSELLKNASPSMPTGERQ
jgi:cell division protease FtsH